MAIWRGPGGPGDAVPDQANSAQLAENFANAAAASATAASTSASNAAASAAAALVSESNASTSASQASSSESNAASSASAALASEQAAALSEANALASEQAAALSESNAASSESNAASSESNAASSEANALASEQAAALSESNAASSESNAAASEAKAQQWATEAEDVPVETSPSNLYSAFHWAQKAEDFAQTINPTDYVTVANNETITGVKTFDNGLNTDTISEETAAAGVTIDGVLLKDNAISATGPSVISVNSTSNALRITQTGSGNALLVEDSTNPDATPVVIDASGREIIGYTNAIESSSGLTSFLQVHATGAGSSVSATRWSNNASQPFFVLSKSRSSTVGTYGVAVQSGDTLGSIVFTGDDGAAPIQAALINAAVDGTPGTNDMPGRLVFSTTADGASSPTERMRITNTGQVRLGAGTVSEPVLSTTGDTNTGIYFPAADTVAIAAGGVESARVVSGLLSIPANSTAASAVRLYEDTDNGTNYVAVKAPDSIASNRTITLPDGTGTAVVNGVNGSIVSGTAVASTSGTSIDFTGIPSWVKRITVMFDGVSTNGSSNHRVQLGDAGGIETTGYASSCSFSGGTNESGGTTSTTGFVTTADISSTSLVTGVTVFSLISGNTWVSAGSSMYNKNTPNAYTMTNSGIKTLSDTLTQIRITTVNGTDTFDAGSINILYE